MTCGNALTCFSPAADEPPETTTPTAASTATMDAKRNMKTPSSVRLPRIVRWLRPVGSPDYASAGGRLRANRAGGARLAAARASPRDVERVDRLRARAARRPAAARPVPGCPADATHERVLRCASRQDHDLPRSARAALRRRRRTAARADQARGAARDRAPLRDQRRTARRARSLLMLDRV